MIVITCDVCGKTSTQGNCSSVSVKLLYWTQEADLKIPLFEGELCYTCINLLKANKLKIETIKALVQQ